MANTIIIGYRYSQLMYIYSLLMRYNYRVHTLGLVVYTRVSAGIKGIDITIKATFM